MALAVEQGVRWLKTGLQAVEGTVCVKRQAQVQPFSEPPAVIALGKAAGAMLYGALDALQMQGLQAVAVFGVTKAGHWQPWVREILQAAPQAVLLEGGHPVPNGDSLAAGRALKHWIATLPEKQPVLVLLSGGASALVEQLKPGMRLQQWQALNQWLLASGLNIEQINQLRAQFSLLKGGGLARQLAPRPITGWVLSDIPQGDVRWVASGLLSPLPPPDKVLWARLPEAWRTGISPDMQSEGVIKPVPLSCIGDHTQARAAVVAAAQKDGVLLRQIEAPLTGDVAQVAAQLEQWRQPVAASGEPTVELPKKAGQGGRNQHLALLMAQRLSGTDGWFISLGTDGTDGNTSAAGAWVDGTTWQRAEQAGLNPQGALAQFDSHRVFKGLGQLIETGPTGTNVADLMLYWPPST